MEGTDLQYDDQLVDTDIFVVIENKGDYYDFVTIDEDVSCNTIVIDMSQDEFANAITINFEDEEIDSFVSIDEDQVFISDITADDLLIDFNYK